ncbi:MAG: dihydrolipoamide acyltransferase, partial [Nitrosospira sp.]
SFRDITSALYLLNEWPRDAKPITGLQSFRNLLMALLAEQQRLTHNMDELSLKLKEEQKRVEILQKQIEAIKSMEKNLILREM